MADKKGIYRGVLTPVGVELAAVLGAAHSDFRECATLLDEWADLVPAGMSVHGVLRIEIAEVLGDPALWASKPYPGLLLAARWLLGLGSCTVQDARRDTAGHGVVAGLTSGNVTDKTKRAQIAFVCLRWEPYWEPEGQLSPSSRTAFNPNASVPSPRTRDVAFELERVIEERRHRLATDPSFLAERRRQWALQLQPRDVHRPASGPGRVAEAFVRLAEAWDEPSRHYPQHLTPSVLAGELTLSPVVDDPRGYLDDSRQRLYADRSTFGGRPLREALDGKRRVVVLGNPGGGKTTGLIAAVIDRVREGSPALFVRLSSLTRGSDKKDRWTLERAIRHMVAVSVADTVAPNASDQDIAAALLGDERAIIALDGLDEVQDKNDEHVHSLLRALGQFPGKVLVSSRWTGYTKLGGPWEELCVDNLDTDHARDFFGRWFAETNPAGLKRALATLDPQAESTASAQLAQIPVLLGIVAVVAGEHDVPETEALLYERYVSMFLEGYWRQRSSRVGLRIRLKHLDQAKALAWSMATGMSGRFGGNRWVDTVTPRQLHSAGDLLPALLNLTHTHGLLVPQGRTAAEDHQEYRWLHRTVHEHLAGAYLAGCVDMEAADFGLPPELLMGAPQWLQPLRHLVGLLSQEDQDTLVRGLKKMVDEGDPGSVITFLLLDLAESTPLGSPARNRLAADYLRPDSIYELSRLDPHRAAGVLADVMRTGDPAELAAVRGHSYAASRHMDATQIREMVEILRATPSRPDVFVDLFAQRLSVSDPDEALRFLVEKRLDQNDGLPFRSWGGLPSAKAVREAIAQVSQLPQMERLSYLHLLYFVGVDLCPFVAPGGPLSELDVRTATALGQRDSDEAEFVSENWPSEVKSALLGGTYGPVWAFEVAYRARDLEPEVGQLGTAAQLALEVRELAASNVKVDSDASSIAAIELLSAATDEALSDDATALRMVRAARDLLEAKEPPPIEMCLHAHWVLGRGQAPSMTRSGMDSFRHRETYDTLFGALTKAMLRHAPDKLLRSIYRTSPSDWIVAEFRYADFEILKVMNNSRLLGVDDIVNIIVWASREDVEVLRYINLGPEVDKVAEIVWNQMPSAFAANGYSWAYQLAQIGTLGPWRDRLVEAGVRWQQLRDSWRDLSDADGAN